MSFGAVASSYTSPGAIGPWLTRSILTASSVDPNGTASHTCTFTPAANGSFLLAVVAGGVTFTTPAEWAQLIGAVSNTGLYVFTKTAGGGEASFTTTHNGANYPIRGIVYEFAAGASILDSNSANSQAQGPITGPSLSGLGGTYIRFAARTNPMPSELSTGGCTWTVPSIVDYDEYTPHTGSTDGIYLTIAYDDAQTDTSYSAAYDVFGDSPTSLGEAAVFAIST